MTRIEVQVGSGFEFEYRDAVKEASGRYICKGMYVINNDGRMGNVYEVIEDGEEEGEGRIKVIVDRKRANFLKKAYITDFEPAREWHKALFDG